jgi:hypothetical protein
VAHGEVELDLVDAAELIREGRLFHDFTAQTMTGRQRSNAQRSGSMVWKHQQGRTGSRSL